MFQFNKTVVLLFVFVFGAFAQFAAKPDETVRSFPRVIASGTPTVSVVLRPNIVNPESGDLFVIRLRVAEFIGGGGRRNEPVTFLGSVQYLGPSRRIDTAQMTQEVFPLDACGQGACDSLGENKELVVYREMITGRTKRGTYLFTLLGLGPGNIEVIPYTTISYVVGEPSLMGSGSFPILESVNVMGRDERGGTIIRIAGKRLPATFKVWLGNGSMVNYGPQPATSSDGTTATFSYPFVGGADYPMDVVAIFGNGAQAALPKSVKLQ